MMFFKIEGALWCVACLLSSCLVAGFSYLDGVKLPSSMSPLTPPASESKADGPGLEKLLQNNKEWAEEKMKSDPTFFQELAKGQSPRYLWIGCSDSRVPAESMTKTDAGQLFVHRNIANQVVPDSPNFLSVLTYAVEYLKVEDIIVCGHYKCGGVAAASSDSDFGPALEDWLIHLREVFGENAKLVEGIEDPDLRQQSYVLMNTKAQCLKLESHPTVLKAQATNNGIPRIHGFVCDLERGLLRNIDAPELAITTSVATDINAKMAPRRGLRSKLANIFKKLPRFELQNVEEEPAICESEAVEKEPATTAKKESADYKRLLAWLLHLGCPEYAELLYSAGYTKFDDIQSAGFSKADLDGIIPVYESGIRKMLETVYHAEYF